jgi:hypothetical protein
MPFPKSGRDMGERGDDPDRQYARYADDLVVLIDAYKRHDWLLTAVMKRLREEFEGGDARTTTAAQIENTEDIYLDTYH